jgi:hypothetical protein
MNEPQNQPPNQPLEYAAKKNQRPVGTGCIVLACLSMLATVIILVSAYLLLRNLCGGLLTR